MPMRPPSMCQACKHLDRRYEANVTGARCTAYPDGIPDRILYGGDSHTDPEPDQGNDIVFDLDPERDFALDAWVRFWYSPVPSGPDTTEGEESQSDVVP